MLSCAPGQPFSETNVAIDRDYILTIYQSSGYPEVTFNYQVLPGDGEHQMKVVYNVIQGQPRFVRDVLITGMHSTSRRLVDPNILLKAGDPLSWTEMGRMQRRLYNLGVFDKVDMAIQNPDGRDREQVRALQPERGPSVLHGGRAWRGNRPDRRQPDQHRKQPGRNRFCAARQPGTQPAESLGARAQPEFQGPLLYAGPPAFAELPGSAVPQRGRPQHFRHGAVRQHARRPAPSTRAGWKAPRSSRSGSPSRPRCSGATAGAT